ncbi:MAG: hypothetical protein RJA36_51, partial [Pseudomonadota bacterium]
VAGVANAANDMQRADLIQQERMRREQDRIAQEEAQSAVTTTMAQGRQRMTEYLVTARDSGEPLAGLTVRALKDLDAWAEQAVAAAPERARPHLTQRLADLKTHVHERAFEYEANARRLAVVDAFQASRESAQRVAMADPTQFGPILAEQIAAANALNLNPAERQAEIEKTRQGIAYAAAVGIVDRAPDAFLQMTGMAGGKTRDGKTLPSDPKKAAEAVQNNPLLSNLKPDALQQLTERATMLVQTREAQAAAEQERARAHAEAAAAKAERDAGRAYTIMRDMVLDGRRIDPANPENKALMAQMQRVPAYANAFATMTQDAAKSAAAATLPLDAQRAQLNALYGQRNAGGASPGLQDEIARREKVLTSAERDYKEDPLTAATSRGVLTGLAPLDMSTPQAMVPGLKARVQQSDLVAQQVGGYVSPFTSAEARQFGDSLAKMPTAQKEATLGMLAQTIGLERMAPTMAQVAKDNVRLAVAGGMYGAMTTAGRSTARNILEGDALLQAKQFKMPTDAKMLEAFQKQVGEAIPTIEGKRAAMEAATAIYAKLRSERGHAADTTVDSTAWSEAVSQVTGGTVDHNGRKVLPARYGAPASETRGLLRGVNADQVKLWGGVAGMSDQEAADYIREAALESVSVGRYRVLAGASILQRKDGSPFELVFR